MYLLLTILVLPLILCASAFVGILYAFMWVIIIVIVVFPEYPVATSIFLGIVALLSYGIHRRFQ